MKTELKLILAGMSALAFTTPTFAQDNGSDGQQARTRLDLIVVTARRREETVQDVPAVVNPVTKEQFDKLNLRDFIEVATVVPGLSLDRNANGIGGNASIRGVNFDVNASGFNSTVEFYYNDAPIQAGAVLQSAFDVGRVEVIRGPQGTLRGRASPSGAVNFITQSPDLQEFGGYVNTTGNNQGGYNFNGALNIPVIDDILGIRVAGLWQENEVNQVRTINTGVTNIEPDGDTRAGRISLAFTPSDFFNFQASYQYLERNDTFYDQYESLNIADPTAPASAVTISAGERLSILETPRINRNEFNIVNGQATFSFAGQNLIYVGQYYDQKFDSIDPSDDGNFFANFDHFQDTSTFVKSHSHEVRLQNEERVFGMLDYVVGGLLNFNDPPTDLTIQTPVRLPVAFGGGLATVVDTDVERRGDSTEKSAFGNLAFHLSDRAEISGGLRYINLDASNQLVVGGTTIVDLAPSDDKIIWTASGSYDVLDNATAYVSYGTSWRPGINAIGDFSLNQSALERSFLNLDGEESNSLEAGMKSKWFDDKLTLNLSAYRQTFDNYPFRSPGGVFFVNFAFGGFGPGGVPIINPEVDQFNFVAAVPVEVKGLEADITFLASDNLVFGGTFSYADGEIENGFIPCNDLNSDGVPDASPATPSLATLLAVVGSDNLSGCNVSQRSAFASPFQASGFFDYTHSFNSDVNGFVRGLLTYDGNSQNDPTNRFDDVDSYGVFNLFTGVRDPKGRWELSFFAKNLFDTQRVLTRDAGAAFTGYQQLGFGGFGPGGPIFTGPTAETFSSDYRVITTTQPREFGINLRYYFGSH